MSDATETLDSIFAPALQATSRAPARFGVSFVPSQKEPVKDRQESDQQALARYPAALRAAAARATSVSRGRLRRQGQDQANEDTAATEEAHAQAISQQRLEEVQRIEGLLRAAPTDFALWNVLDREVFSMIGSLGLDKVSKSTKRRTKSTPSTPPVNKSPGQEPDSMTRLAIVSSIYPQLLLLAMRILQHDFRSPSACLALLAQIKALGPISHVLGASTAIYNDILLLQWKAYGDPGAVASTLDEMDATGVEGDAGTATVVHRILEERKKQLRLQRWKGRPTTPAMLYALESYLVGFGSLSRWRAVFRARVAAAAAAQKMERQEEGEGDEEEEYEEPAETKVTSR
ncbi:MAG: hypothetical protein M1838_004831 [Thelocarpon superellum]|nr:MAG: hypothetical protein M1838_004831 [Thelocarpon superellum]